MVRRKMIERDAHFCARKMNEHGRYLSILTLNREGRSVLTIPEPTLNVGWWDIALKIENFIKKAPRVWKR